MSRHRRATTHTRQIVLRAATILLTVALIALIAYGVALRRQEGDAGGFLGELVPPPPPPVFTTAGPGECLTWEVATAGGQREVTAVQTVPCAEPHRFEVTSRHDLGSDSGTEFATGVPLPSVERQLRLNAELCGPPARDYLGGRLDPAGRFAVASLLPPPANWDARERTVLCGVQTPDATGTPLPSTGSARTADQARTFPPGTCLRYAADGTEQAVDCAAPHQVEVTAPIDLSERFGPTPPTVPEQDAYLEETCLNRAISHLGSEEALYQSTLLPFWTTLTPARWQLGSRSVHCGLIAASSSDTFATLQGPATGSFTINGTPPAIQPDRPPLGG